MGTFQSLNNGPEDHFQSAASACLVSPSYIELSPLASKLSHSTILSMKCLLHSSIKQNTLAKTSNHLLFINQLFYI